MKKVVVILLVLSTLLAGCTDMQRAQVDVIASAFDVLYDNQAQSTNLELQKAQFDAIATAANIMYFEYQTEVANSGSPSDPIGTEVPPVATEVPPTVTQNPPTSTPVPQQPTSTTVPPTPTAVNVEPANVKHLYPGSSLRSAINALAPGDTLYVHGGVYTETIDIAQNDIKIIGVDNPKIQQSAVGTWGTLVRIRGNSVTMSGFEITGSDYMGLLLQGIGDAVSEMNVHHNGENGILITGNYSMVENSQVWQNCLSHYNGVITRSGWASGLTAARRPVGAVIRNNKVFQNWGEGLSTYEASETVIENNEVYDNWSTNIYVSDAQNITVSGNTVYNTGYMPNGSNVGIMLGDEKYNPASRDIQILNNNVYNTNRNLYYWVGTQGGGLVNVVVRGNTFTDSKATNNVQLSGTNNVNVTFEQNTVTQNDGLPIALIGKCSQITFRGNTWSKTPPCPESN